MLFKHVAAVRQHRGFCAVGQTVEFCPGACEVTLGAADQAEVFEVNRDDVLHVIGGVGQSRVGKEGLQWVDQIFGDVLSLPHHDVAAQVEVARWLGHLQQLLFFQAADGDFVDFHLDARLLGELR